VGKIYNDEWMLERGFLDVKTVKDLINGLGPRRLVTIEANDTVGTAIDLMKKYDIEQIPVVGENGEFRGSITQVGLFKKIVEIPDLKDQPVQSVMEAAIPVVSMETPVERLSGYITKDNSAILTKDDSGQFHIITKYDVLNALSKG
jgi:cystathionine beta-synthase (EC 4.2.1.22)